MPRADSKILRPVWTILIERMRKGEICIVCSGRFHSRQAGIRQYHQRMDIKRPPMFKGQAIHLSCYAKVTNDGNNK